MSRVPLLGFTLALCALWHSEAIRAVEEDYEVENASALVDMEVEASTALVSKEEALPADYWSKEKALHRCRAARRNLVIKSIPSVLMVFGSTFWAVKSALAAFTAAKYGPFIIYFAKPITAAVVGGATLDFSTRISDRFIEILIGVGGTHPSCCCPHSKEVGVNEKTDCHLVGTTRWRKDAVCPAGWDHKPQMCQTVEVDHFHPTTIKDCKCQFIRDCKLNQFFHGHPWCQTKPGCGRRYLRAPWRRWDFCQHSQEPVRLGGHHFYINEALAQFKPNVPEGLRTLRLRADSALKLGVWTDGTRGIATARSGILKRRECFAAIPIETLEACAQTCLQGAQNARAMVGRDDDNYDCVAFAFNREKHLCVTLPEFARRAEFFPSMRRKGAGWQNYILKSDK